MNAITSFALAGPFLALASCDSAAPPVTATASSTQTARVSGQVRDSAGLLVAGARVHLYQDSSDSARDTVVLTGPDGSFEASVRPGKLDAFIESGSDGSRQAQVVHFDQITPTAKGRRDTIRLLPTIEGTLKAPGLSGVSSVSATIQGSPLTCQVGTDGSIRVEALRGSDALLTVALAMASGSHQVYRFRITVVNGVVRFQPVADTDQPTSPASATPTGVETVIYQPGPAESDDVGIIGSLHGSSPKDNNNYGIRPVEGIGGAYDENAVGRELWHYQLPDSVRGRQILSAKLEFRTANWHIRPTGGQDLTIEGYRLLRPWNQGHGSGQDGVPVSASNDGASATGPSYGSTWHQKMVGLDGVDAQPTPTTRSTLPYLSMETMVFDVTAAVQGWLADPTTNFGLLFRSIHEDDGQYLDYPGFYSNDAADPATRPRLILSLAPKTTDPSIHVLSLQPGPGGHDAAIIGTFSGTGSHDGNNQGTVAYQSLGGSWDYNTVGRLLWQVPLPDSLAGKTILSAKAVFKVEGYMGRPVKGHDYKVEAYRMLRAWKEGSGIFPGQPNSLSIDGATSLDASYGVRWNEPLVGLDGIDAEAIPSAVSILPYGDTTSMAFDFTQLVKLWLANPSGNHGVLFRSIEELDPSFPDYPGFGMSEDSIPSHRPRLVIQYR